LDGEAFFDVSKSKDKFFNVYSSNIFIRVLGTQFNVKSYESDNVIETTLKEGRINIYEIGKNENRQIVTLSPNQKVTYVKGTGKVSSENLKREYQKTVEKDEEVRYQESNYIIARKVNINNYSSWKDGKLIFRKDRLEDIALSLERHFNVDINFEDEKAKNVLINANFKNETIEQVLYALSLTSSIDYEMNLNQISIKYKPGKIQSE
jgi:ferric-dicitrate binding protein FerR (iron transport regulator)